MVVGACEDPITGQLYMPCAHFHYYNLGNGALIPLCPMYCYNTVYIMYIKLIYISIYCTRYT